MFAYKEIGVEGPGNFRIFQSKIQMMKKSLFLSFLAGFVLSAHSQNVLFFPNALNTWTVAHHEGFETISTAFAMLPDSAGFFPLRQHNCQMVADQFLGYFHFEEEQVYFRFEDIDYLMYDYSLEPGDLFFPSISFAPWGICIIEGESPSLEVLSVDSIELAGIWRKRLTLNSGFTGETHLWIEGFGSSKGLLHDGLKACQEDWDSDLVCAFTGEELSFHNPDLGEDEPSTCCPILLSTSSISEAEIHLSPNPVRIDEMLKISLNADINYLSVFNLQGKKVSELQNDRDWNYEIPMSQFEPGMYFLVGETDKFRLTAKFIVVE
jgi:hypothetical protein